ncbi:MAG: multicopper oxidase domain-containing protein [Gammaproteobacteria bacterium]|nr:multicopper oxidase domain-containing protein [Gammaproteobacteria bacterium]
MNINKQKVVLACLPILLCTQVANAVPVAGGTLDPLTIPKYVTPLVIPPVMNSARPAFKPNGTPDGLEYDIAVRQFQQQILPGGIWDTLGGTTFNFPATTVWSYGPDADSTPAVAPDPNSQFNYPAYTIENIKDTKTTVNWINGLVDEVTGNALPHLFSVDQTLHWANPAADCSVAEVRTDCHGTTDQPYTGPVPMVTHVHGAHVGASGDGYTEAWWLPDAKNITCVLRDADGVLTATPTGYDAATNTWDVACEGTIANQLTNKAGGIPQNTGGGKAKFGYPNDQPSSTIWYHDHSLGLTRLNVYAGPAGYWLIRDLELDANGLPLYGSNETGLDINSILPAPAPVAGDTVLELNAPSLEAGTLDKRSGIREMPIAIQGRSFNTDGSLFYPDNRAFFEGLNVEDTVAAGTEQFPGAPELQIDMDPATSDIAPIWNPEAFFNTMVVNGVTWPKLEVAPALYRFRLLNGANSRFLNLAMPVTDALGNPTRVKRTIPIFEDDGRSKKPKSRWVDELRFWQIGAEQSLMPEVVAVRTGFATAGLTPTKDGKFKNEILASDPQQALLMGLAERADVIVDFRGLPDGTIITMTNTAPDAPFGGFPDVPADPATTGQVVRFVVNDALLGASPTDELHPAVGDPIIIDGIPVLDKKGRPLIANKQLLSTILNPATAATSPWDLLVDPAVLGNFTVAVTNPTPRELALVEEESALICADTDLLGNVVQLVDYIPVAGACALKTDVTVIHPTALPFAPKAAVLGTVDPADGSFQVTLWSDPIATNVNAPLVENPDGTTSGGGGTAEQWNLWNFTVDGHPIHVHLVKFKVLGRTAIGGGASIITTATGAQPWENGWKDTVITYPGEVTSLAADFDINGLYVWHCHILEHEDNEMMVPFCVGEEGVNCPAQLF